MDDFSTTIWLCDVGSTAGNTVRNTADSSAESDDGRVSRFLAGAPAQRVERVLGIAAPAARLESAAVTALLYYALAHTSYSVSCDAVRFVCPQELVEAAGTAALPDWPTGVHGQPFPDGVAVGTMWWFVSLSHSSGLVAVAVSRQPVGLDVQRLPGWSAEHARRIRARIAHPGDSPAVGDDVAAVVDCCRLWALKESAVKLTGEGFSRLPNSFAVTGAAGRYAAQLGGRKVAMRLYPCQGVVVAAASFA